LMSRELFAILFLLDKRRDGGQGGRKGNYFIKLFTVVINSTPSNICGQAYPT
jgi:hypothetical protein